jgi:methyl-accepting chemotaxis protein
MTSFLRRFNIRQRLLSLIVIVILGGFGAAAITFVSLHNALMTEKAAQTQHLVESAHAVIAAAHAHEQAGEWSRAEAQANAITLLKQMRYGNNNYFWINDMQPAMVMHPLKPELDGQPLGRVTDPSGMRLFSKMVDVVRQDGSGSVQYAWPRPGSDEPVNKMSYVKGFAPWGWIVGSGVYTDDISERFTETIWALGVLIVTVTGLVVLVQYLISDSILKPIRAAAEAMREVASGDGDLTNELPTDGRDEIAAMASEFNRFIAKTRELVATAGDATHRLGASSASVLEIANGSAEAALAQRTETDLVATAVNEMNASAGEIARSAAEAAAAARQTDERATEGRTVMQQSVAAMQQLADGLHTVGGVVAELKSQSESIGSVLDVIRNIAEQTNLLALNAAIEAARAGEQGRGFAVVADEVRTLASRTQDSTQEIQNTIERLQKEAAKAFDVMQGSQGQSQQTLELAGQADAALASIVDLVATISDMNNQIAGAAEEQTSVSGEIDRNVVQIAALAEKAESGCRETADASREIAAQTSELQQLVGRFKT